MPTIPASHRIASHRVASRAYLQVVEVRRELLDLRLELLLEPRELLRGQRHEVNPALLGLLGRRHREMPLKKKTKLEFPRPSRTR